MTLEDRLERIEALLTVLVERDQVREWYSVGEFARLVGRCGFTVREWCRQGRLLAAKKESGRGAYTAWSISHEELLRYQREGLRPAGRAGFSQHRLLHRPGASRPGRRRAGAGGPALHPAAREEEGRVGELPVRVPERRA
jgi:hypothetical protein